ncbi:hypothetical protein V2O93_04945 [Streptococcus pneumoniae]|nr:hypothetical protein [Streptococcus pneumoniae]HEU3701985.1 hypothetical protein [Streptococcus pneumoniae]
MKKRIVLLVNIPYKTKFEKIFWDKYSEKLNTNNITIVHIGSRIIHPSCVENYQVFDFYKELTNLIDLQINNSSISPGIVIRDSYKNRRSISTSYKQLTCLYYSLDSFFRENEILCTIYWGGTEPICRFARDISRNYGVKSMEAERSPLNTLWIEENGVFNVTSVQDKYITKNKNIFLGYVAINRLLRNIYGFRSSRDRNYRDENDFISNKIHVFIPMDNVIESGWIPYMEELTGNRYKEYTSPEVVFQQLNEFDNLEVVIGVHPSCQYNWKTVEQKYGKMKFVYDYDLKYYLEKSDIVICGLTKVAFVAASMRKIVYIFANNIIQLSGYSRKFTDFKGDVMVSKFSLESWIEFIEFCGWLESYFFSNSISDIDRLIKLTTKRK